MTSLKATPSEDAKKHIVQSRNGSIVSINLEPTVIENGNHGDSKNNGNRPPPYSTVAQPKSDSAKTETQKKNKKKKKKKKKGKDGTDENDDDDDDNDEEKEEPTPVPFFQLFRYATPKEVSLMITGVLASMIAGICLPAMVILFGRLTNAFVYQSLLSVNITDYGNYSQYSNLSNEEIAAQFNITFDFHQKLRVFGVGVSIIGFLELIMGYIFVTCFNYAAEAQMFRLRGLFLKSTLKQEIGYFDTHQTNDFASRATEDMNKMQEGMGEKIGMFIFFTTNFIGSLINAFYHGWLLTLVICSVFPLLGVSMGILAKVQTSLVALELKEYARAGSIAEEVISSIRTVASYGGEQKEVERYEKNLVYAKNAGLKRGLTTGTGMGMAWLFIYGAYALGFWYGTKLILASRPPDGDGKYDPSDLIIVFFSVLMGAMNMGQSSPYVEAFNTARGAAANIYGVIERPSEIDPTIEQGVKLKNIEGTIEFHNVFFNYPSRPTVKILQGVNLKITPGQTVALVGSSGCGKSTCIQLIQRFYDPEMGSVCIDGNNIRSFNVGWLREHIGVVGQEPVLFGTSIEENIRYGRDNATLEEIQQAAIEANAHDFIMKLPKQYDTQVGERGTQISGGQKQRIAIARALIKRPKILLLDEATSALDNQSEALVQRALDKVRKGRTTVIVAHRLSTIKTADKIVVMDKGEVVESGNHKELMAKNGAYNSLVNAQINPGDTDKKKAREIDVDSSSDDENENGLMDTVDDILDDLTMKGPTHLTRLPSIRQSNKAFRRKSSAKNKKKKKKKTGEDDEDELVPMSSMEILRMNKTEWHYITVGVIASAIQGCIMPAFAILFGNILGTLALADPEEAQSKANKYAMLFVVVGIVAGISMFLQFYMFSLSGEILTMRIRKRAFTSMLQQEMGWFDDQKNSVGALCSRLSGDASAIQGATGSRIGTLIQALVTLVAGIVLAMVYSPKLGAVTLPFLPLIIASVYIQSKMIMGQSITESKVLEDVGKIAIEAIGNIRTIASLHKEAAVVERYTAALREPHLEALKKSHLRGISFGFANSMMFFAYAVVMSYGGVLVDKGEMDFSEVFKVAEALILGTAMVGQAVAFAPNYGKARVASGRLAILFSRRPKIDTSAGVGLRMTKEVSCIELKDVNFSYPTRPSVLILKGMNASVRKGETIALVGSSGCGKSTIINLLERFYNPTSGEVVLNDNNIEALNVGYVRSLFGLVSQEPVLFDRTIAENIAYGDNTRSFSFDDIELAAKQANIHDFVKQLPEGYDTRVGSKGTQLSGGQKQRIAIARALIRNPQVLLLDEATSALDAESEKIVQETLEEVQTGRTSIIIAHRLSTIRGANKIIVMENGEVVETGTHESLLTKNGAYSSLYQTNA